MTGTEITTVRNEIVEAQESGDLQTANEAYARELDMLRQDTAERKSEYEDKVGNIDVYLLQGGLVSAEEIRPLTELPADHEIIQMGESMDQLFSVVSATVRKINSDGLEINVSHGYSEDVVDDFLDGFTKDQIRQLNSSVMDLPRTLKLASYLCTIAERRYPDIEIPDAFEFWHLALQVTERIRLRMRQTRTHESKPIRQGESQPARDEYLDTLEAFEEKISEYQAKGRYREANRVYQDQQAWLASRQTDNRIIGSGGRNA